MRWPRRQSPTYTMILTESLAQSFRMALPSPVDLETAARRRREAAELEAARHRARGLLVVVVAVLWLSIGVAGGVLSVLLGGGWLGLFASFCLGCAAGLPLARRTSRAWKALS